jgi:hypothetical protein
MELYKSRPRQTAFAPCHGALDIGTRLGAISRADACVD